MVIAKIVLAMKGPSCNLYKKQGNDEWRTTAISENSIKLISSKSNVSWRCNIDESTKR